MIQSFFHIESRRAARPLAALLIYCICVSLRSAAGALAIYSSRSSGYESNPSPSNTSCRSSTALICRVS